MKASRLFWKLFLAFWLATTLTFFVGMGFVILSKSKPGDPHLDTILTSEIHLLETLWAAFVARRNCWPVSCPTKACATTPM